MVYNFLAGGLGNMLFMIAATLSISIEKNLDCSFPNFNGHLNFLDRCRQFRLDTMSAEEYKIFLNFLKTESPTSDIPTINYPFHYVNFELPNQPFAISGFFQSEKYFYGIRDILLNKFRLPIDLENQVKSKYSFILEKNSTSVHVRRGDYLSYQDIHPPCDINYFETAMNVVKKNTDIFIVFSDDSEWCRNNLKGDNLIFIDEEKDYIELFLMSFCSNNIISNSSFSWWGAWLNQTPEKVVIGPSRWFGNRSNLSSKDVLPNSWIKI